MNERIKLLAEQAGMKPCADMSKFGMNEDMNPYNCQEFMLEKFAQLIVRECAGIYDKIDNGNLHMGSYDYLEALQKTFGVE